MKLIMKMRKMDEEDVEDEDDDEEDVDDEEKILMMMKKMLMMKIESASGNPPTFTKLLCPPHKIDMNFLDQILKKWGMLFPQIFGKSRPLSEVVNKGHFCFLQVKSTCEIISVKFKM